MLIRNLALIYALMSDYKDKQENLTKSKRLLDETIDLCVKNHFSLGRAQALYNKGINYRRLSQIADKENNLDESEKSFIEASKVYETLSAFDKRDEMIIQANISKNLLEEKDKNKSC